MILDFNFAVLRPMIDRMLGGGREPALSSRRPLTRIENRLARRIIDLFLDELKGIWQNTAEMELSVVQTESNPLWLQAVPPNETVVVLCFEVILVDVRGSMVLCILLPALKQLYFTLPQFGRF